MVRITKEIEQLFNKWKKQGYASKNGKMLEFGFCGNSELREKWEFSTVGNYLLVSHWGTTILRIDTKTGVICYSYVQSKTDAQTIEAVAYLLGFDEVKCSWKPSKQEYHLTADFGTGEYITKVR